MWNSERLAMPPWYVHRPSGPTRGANARANAAAPAGPTSQKLRLRSRSAALHTHRPESPKSDAAAETPDAGFANSSAATQRGESASAMATTPSSPMLLNSRLSDRSVPLNTHDPSALRRPCSALAKNVAPSGPMDAFAKFKPVTRASKVQFPVAG